MARVSLRKTRNLNHIVVNGRYQTRVFGDVPSPNAEV
jgi:hypothetical protein